MVFLWFACHHRLLRHFNDFKDFYDFNFFIHHHIWLSMIFMLFYGGKLGQAFTHTLNKFWIIAPESFHIKEKNIGNLKKILWEQSKNELCVSYHDVEKILFAFPRLIGIILVWNQENPKKFLPRKPRSQALTSNVQPTTLLPPNLRRSGMR